MQEDDGMTPEHHEGIKKDIEHSVIFENPEDAGEHFIVAKNRLLDINRWHDITHSMETKFELTDHNGHELHRMAHKGDYVKIDTPAPGPVSGEGKDWVIVEELVYDDFPDEDREAISMRLRPVSSPLSNDAAAAHFFSDDSTSTFIIEHDHKKVTARYHGRNELPNTKADSFMDKLRNTVVAVGAMLGFSDVQWDGLIKGIIAKDNDD